MSRRLPDHIVFPLELNEHVRDGLTQVYRLLSREVNNRTFDVTSISSSQVVASDLVLVDAAAGEVTAFLPPAEYYIDRSLRVKKKDSSVNLVKVVAHGSETVDETVTIAVSNQYSTVQMVSDGTQWWLV